MVGRIQKSNADPTNDVSSATSYPGWVPRVESEKTLAHSRNHVTDLSTESGNLFKMAAKIKSERIWVRGLETGEKQPTGGKGKLKRS